MAGVRACYYTTILLDHCSTVLLCGYTAIILTTLLQDYSLWQEFVTTILLYYYTTLLLYYCTTILLYYCTTVLLYFCTRLLLYFCTTILLHYCTTILLYIYEIIYKCFVLGGTVLLYIYIKSYICATIYY